MGFIQILKSAVLTFISLVSGRYQLDHVVDDGKWRIAL